MDDLYSIVGVARDASQEEIRAAYKRRANILHPDKNLQDGSSHKFQELQMAYRILSCPEQRAHYDETGRTGGETVISEAENILSQLFLDMASKSDYLPLDYPKKIEGHIRTLLLQCEADKRKLSKNRARLLYIRQNTQLSDRLFNAIDKQIAEFDSNLRHCEQATMVLGRALDMAEGFAYTGEVTEPERSRFNITETNTIWET